MMQSYLPEGSLLNTPENLVYCASRKNLIEAMETGRVLEGKAILCDREHDLIVKVGDFTGLIPRTEGALGIAEGTTREIALLSRVGKPIAFTIEAVEGPESAPSLLLSRRRAQQAALDRYISRLQPGMVIPAAVTHLEPFGAFVDVGCGIPSMLGVETISVSRIPHPDQRFTPGQSIFAAVTEVNPELGRVSLTHKELLGTWSENADRFSAGMTVPGTVRGIKDYGLFIELTPNLSGLAEYRGDLKIGDRVSVYIKVIIPERMKIKLVVIDKLPPEEAPDTLEYFIRSGRMTRWQYAPEDCEKAGTETVFIPAATF